MDGLRSFSSRHRWYSSLASSLQEAARASGRGTLLSRAAGGRPAVCRMTQEMSSTIACRHQSRVSREYRGRDCERCGVAGADPAPAASRRRQASKQGKAAPHRAAASSAPAPPASAPRHSSRAHRGAACSCSTGAAGQWRLEGQAGGAAGRSGSRRKQQQAEDSSAVHTPLSKCRQSRGRAEQPTHRSTKSAASSLPMMSQSPSVASICTAQGEVGGAPVRRGRAGRGRGRAGLPRAAAACARPQPKP